eukprot:8142795-Ditylum_brightwellii.AAC.1
MPTTKDIIHPLSIKSKSTSLILSAEDADLLAELCAILSQSGGGSRFTEGNDDKNEAGGDTSTLCRCTSDIHMVQDQTCTLSRS